MHLTEYGASGNDLYGWATAGTNAAATAGAKVQTNSWGYNTSLIDDEITLKNNNGWNSYETFANRAYGDTSSASVTKITDYITALNNFQSNGVVVFSNSNTSSNDNAEITAALPELFPELEEAFLAVVNIEIDGAAGSETYTRMSAPCGDAARYCLGADAYGINTLDGANGYTYVDRETGDGETSYSVNTGTSYAAPQVTAAVAILAEAFPNQTPEQWADRILASANNQLGFSNIGKVTFETASTMVIPAKLTWHSGHLCCFTANKFK